MIIYIASHSNNTIINRAIEDSAGRIILPKVEINFNFTTFVKQQLEQIQMAKIFIIDISALSDSDDDIVMSLNSFRLINDEIKVIIVAPFKNPGDKLLNEIFAMGIYDIVTFESETDKEKVIEEIAFCIQEGKKYKDSVIYKGGAERKDKEGVSKKGKKQIVTEKIVVKTETSVSKALIGFIGMQSRIGVTHNCIASANYLRKMGYSVAVLESNKNLNKVLESIKNMEEIEEHIDERYFTYEKIDYYPDYDISESYKIQAKGYNFILIDFGNYITGMDLIELNRCVKSIVLLGSKPWEIGEANNLFSNVDTTLLESYNYLFNFTSKEKEDFLKESMGDLKKVYFANYSPNPFKVEEYEVFKTIFSEYTKSCEEKMERRSIFNKLFGGREC